MRKRYPQPHRKMYLAWKKGLGITLSRDELGRLFTTDQAMYDAATQGLAGDDDIFAWDEVMNNIQRSNK